MGKSTGNHGFHAYKTVYLQEIMVFTVEDRGFPENCSTTTSGTVGIICGAWGQVCLQGAFMVRSLIF